MTEIVVKLPGLHPAQKEAVRNMRRFAMICAGRRFGKDVLLERLAVKALLKSGQPVGWFAPTYRMLSENYKEMRDLLADVLARENASDHRLELLNGNVLDMWSLENHDAARGRKYGLGIINEAAMVGGLGDAWAKVIRPTLADYQGRAIFASTPRGLNDFYRLWVAAGDNPDWSRAHYRTDDNPYIQRDEIIAMRTALPGRVVRQEIDAEFVEDGSFFQGVDKVCTVQEREQPEAHAGHSVFGGLDWAMSEDYTVLTLFCRDCARVVDWWRVNQMEYIMQRVAIIEMCKRWGIVGLLPETNSIGQPNIEMLADAGLPILAGHNGNKGFTTTATTKAELIQALAAGIETAGLAAPVEYMDELKTYEVITSSTTPKFSAPNGAHDDRVISLALSWWAATRCNNWWTT